VITRIVIVMNSEMYRLEGENACTDVSVCVCDNWCTCSARQLGNNKDKLRKNEEQQLFSIIYIYIYIYDISSHVQRPAK
jgi:hypothetical protein